MMEPKEDMETPKCPKHEKHLWEYVWEGLYRRCQRQGCKAAEWNYADNHYMAGRPCGISTQHPLSARAVASAKGAISSIDAMLSNYRLLIKNPKTDPRTVASMKKSLQHYASLAELKSATAVGAYKIDDIGRDIQRGYFLREKERIQSINDDESED